MENEVRQLLSPKLYSDILSVTEGSADFSRFNNKTVLITGAGQMLGIYLSCALLIHNDLANAQTRVIAVDSRDDLVKKYGKLTRRTDIDFITSRDYTALFNTEADFVLHTENFSNLDSETALINLLGYIKKTGAAAVLNTYADVYGNVFNGKDKLCEDDYGYIDPADPKYKSIQAQRMAESLSLRLTQTDDLDLRVSRSSLIYGATEFNGDSSYTHIFSEAIKGNNLQIGSNDYFPKSYCYVTDACEALLLILLNGAKGEVYNISSGYIASTALLAQNCVKLFSDKELKIVATGAPKHISPISPTISVLDNSKLVGLGFTAKVSVAKGIARSVGIISEVM